MPPNKIAAGVRTDFEVLLRNFQHTKSVRFEEFSKIWRQMGISNIYCGHENEKELMQFTDECLLLAVTFCLPPHSFQWRAGGLYLVYGLYLKQPNVIKTKVRVTVSQWEEITDFIEEVKEQCHHDIHFVFLKLLQNHAFHFVASSREMAPFYRELSEGTTSCYFLETSSLKELLDDGYCDQMEAIHQRYIAMKNQVLPNDSSVNSIDADFISFFETKIEEFERKRLTLVDGYDNDQEAGENRRNDDDHENMKKVEDIGVRRGMLKKLVMDQKGSTSRSRRHRAVEIASSSTAATSPKKKKQKTNVSKNPDKKQGPSRSDPSSPVNLKEAEDDCYMSMPVFSSEVHKESSS